MEIAKNWASRYVTSKPQINDCWYCTALFLLKTSEFLEIVYIYNIHEHREVMEKHHIATWNHCPLSLCDSFFIYVSKNFFWMTVLRRNWTVFEMALGLQDLRSLSDLLWHYFVQLIGPSLPYSHHAWLHQGSQSPIYRSNRILHQPKGLYVCNVI